MRITRKLQLNTLMVLALLVLNGVVAIVLVQRMMGDVRQLVEVEEPLEEAILEMEINVGETARAVLDYIRDHEERDIERMHDSEGDFERYAREFERLAETEDEQELGRQVAELYQDFKTLGDEIVSMSRQRRDDLLVLRQDVARIDELIDENPQPAIDRSAADAMTKLEAALDMEINIHETVAAIEGYILEASPEFKPKIVDSERDFNRFHAQYRGTRLSGDEEKWLDQIARDFTEVVTAGNEIIALTDGMRDKLERFEDNLEEIDRILDDEVQVLIHEQTVLAAEDARRSGEIAIAFILGTGIFILLIVAGASWIVSKGIIDTTGRLAKGAVQFGRGNLEHRIEMPTTDELGSLGRSFNTMAETLQQTMASRDDLVEEVEARERVEAELRSTNTIMIEALEQEKRARCELEEEITERKLLEAEREQMHTQLVDASRQAGMAEVATGVLHNVGNVLNSVNVTATLVRAMVQDSKAPDLLQISRILQQHADDLGLFITTDDKGRLIPAFLSELGGHLVDEQETILGELQSLTKNIEHIKEIVSMQQSYANVSGVEMAVSLADLVEDALRINSAGLDRHGAQVVREFQAIPDVIVDKQKVLQILVNLISNAKYALTTAGLDDKTLTVRIATSNDQTERVRIDVIDSGVGIPPENLTRIFSHGFTTKQDGHGFGLHSCALAAQSIGGSITVQSDGLNRGAAFSLHIPLKVAQVSQ